MKAAFWAAFFYAENNNRRNLRASFLE
jgi:hypothetical protein